MLKEIVKICQKINEILASCPLPVSFDLVLGGEEEGEKFFSLCIANLSCLVAYPCFSPGVRRLAVTSCIRAGSVMTATKIISWTDLK